MTPFERRSVWLTTAGTLITGLVYWWMKEFMTPPDPWAVVNHPLQPWLLKAHILIAPLQVFAVGLITSRHVWRHFTMGVKKGRKSGLVAAGTFIALVLTGYGLQVVSTELLIRTLAWAHLVLGVVYSIGVAAHWPATRGKPESVRPETAAPAPGIPPRSAAIGGAPGFGHERRRRTRSHRDTPDAR
jgi:hypothetical protein